MKPLKLGRINFEDLILYEDPHLICVNKPAGITSLDLRNEPNTGLLSVARKYLPEIKICHRLDRMTTGVLLFAKNLETYRSISMQFEKRQIEKHYWALIRGAHRLIDTLIQSPLSDMVKGKVHVDLAEGKPSSTIVNTEQAFAHFTLVDAQPLTGRSHQIRVHLASIGCPIVGDLLYGGKDLLLSDIKRNYRYKAEEEESALNHGYLLHARSLKLLHPATETQTEFFAPLSKNMDMCMRQLEKYDSI